ncbi:MAG: hypothetical protein V3V61_01460 [Gammaproteobacteria bacterium]
MKDEPLSKSNKYLRDPKARSEAIRQNVISSSAIEGVDVKRLEKILPKKTGKKGT